jgi:hypothetical protein
VLFCCGAIESTRWTITLPREWFAFLKIKSWRQALEVRTSTYVARVHNGCLRRFGRRNRIQIWTRLSGLTLFLRAFPPGLIHGEIMPGLTCMRGVESIAWASEWVGEWIRVLRVRTMKLMRRLLHQPQSSSHIYNSRIRYPNTRKSKWTNSAL